MPKKQKSGLYRTKMLVGVDADGKKIYKYLSAKTMKELEAAKQEAVTYYIDGAVRKDDRLFGDYAVEWYRLRKEPFISSSMRASYRSMLNSHILPTFGDRNLRAIRTNDIQSWLNELASKSDTQITLAMTIFKGVMKAACADSYLIKDPTAYLVKPKTSDAKQRRALLPEETKAILSLIQQNENGLYLATLYYLGLRPGEARGLQWGDFDWVLDLVHVQRDIDYTAKKGELGQLKTAAANRYVPIPVALRDLLYTRRGVSNSFVFQARGGAPWSKSTAERVWLSLMREAGLVEEAPKNWKFSDDIRAKIKPVITPYYLRHNYITMCWEAGLDPLVTMRIVGHEDYHTTASVYTHLKNEHLEKSRQSMEEVFANKKVAQKLHKDSSAGENKKKKP